MRTRSAVLTLRTFYKVAMALTRSTVATTTITSMVTRVMISCSVEQVMTSSPAVAATIVPLVKLAMTSSLVVPVMIALSVVPAAIQPLWPLVALYQSLLILALIASCQSLSAEQMVMIPMKVLKPLMLAVR